MNIHSRNIGLDLIRSLAILCVICGHFFMNTHFNSTVFSGASMFLQAAFKFLFGIGVPLFVILTGYLNNSKTASKHYYMGVFRILATYLVFSIITILFRHYYLGETQSWLRWGLDVLAFSAIPYAWYIEMWIGLFLLIPFLNILYKALSGKRQKLLLISTLYLMTAAPDMCNRYGVHLVPGFWKDLWPLFFYFSGCYIREYQPRIPRLCIIVGILSIILVNPVFNVLFIHNRTLIHIAGGPWGMLGMPLALLAFLALYKWDSAKSYVRLPLTTISLVSLEMYLCCYMVDAFYYPIWLKKWFTNQSDFGIHFFTIVPVLFLSCFIIAFVYHKTKNIIMHAFIRP